MSSLLLAAVFAAGSAAPAVAAPGAPTRIAGADRYATAAALALSGWSGADTVVVASGSGATDALSASSMAGVLDAPVLLTAPDTAPAPTLAAIKQLAPSFVIVLGGTSAVSPAAFELLTASSTGYRLAGPDRYATAAKVLTDFHTSPLADGPAPRTAYLARGDVAADDVPADALAVSPLAWKGRTPVLLTGRDTLPRATATAIRAGGVTRVVVLGGTGAVSDEVAGAVEALPGVSVTRIAGADRSGTAAALAASAVADHGFSAIRVGVASGRSVDALAAGPVAGKAGYPLLLASSPTDLGATTRGALAARGAKADVVVIGGQGAVADAAVVGAAG